MENLKIFILATRKNDDGYIIISSLMVLVLVTVIGVMSVRTSNSDLEISTNQQFFGRSFYAAEAARAFVYTNPDIYGSSNLDPLSPRVFPDSTDLTSILFDGNYYRPIILGGQEAFRGRVEYVVPTEPARGLGNDRKFAPQHYKMTCDGHGQYNGPRDSTTRIEAGFYRIGFNTTP